MHDDALQQLLEDHGETVIVTPPGGSGAYQLQALIEEIDPQSWRSDSKGNTYTRNARATVRTADCTTVPSVTNPAWTIAARGVNWQVVGLTSGPVSLILTLRHVTGVVARSPRPGN